MCKQKAIIWGIGRTAVGFLKRTALYAEYEIVAFTDNDQRQWGNMFWNGVKVVSPEEVNEIDYETIIICSIYSEEIKNQINCELGIYEKEIVTFRDIEISFCKRVVEKYRNSEDKEMQASLDVFRRGNPNVLGAYAPDLVRFHPVYRDDAGFPYIIFEEKRMYYPKQYQFEQKDGQEVVSDILYEQGEDSPHLYVRRDDEIPNNAVIVDAGVCEGNFALRYVERAKKIYLVEADQQWMEALYKTFEGYRDKVVFCNKFLSGHDNEKETTLDSLVQEQIDFLKMDIEGAEVDALLGGRSVLERSNARCAVCSYHRQYDEKYITYILNSYGYHTDYSKGYMFFPFDQNVSHTMDLRHGVVYGWKGKK